MLPASPGPTHGHTVPYRYTQGRTSIFWRVKGLQQQFIKGGPKHRHTVPYWYTQGHTKQFSEVKRASRLEEWDLHIVKQSHKIH